VADRLVSVVVPTRDRPEHLTRLLESLRGQSLPAEEFEVVVVDDGSGADTRAAVERELVRGGLALRYRRLETGGGPAAARNLGWRVARAPLIAFTDDDCAAEARWLEAALAAAAARPTTILQGRTVPDPAALAAAPRGRVGRHTVHVQRLGPQYETCNIFYPRATLEALAGFDEAYGARPAAEDTDLAWRAIESGVSTAFVSDAVVFHAVTVLSPGLALRRALRWSPAIRVFAEHPQARQMLHRGIFWNVWHYLVWRSLLALAAPRWLRRLLFTRHLMELRARARRDGAGVWAVPFLLVHDLVECWAIARGAIRYRTLVL